MTDLIRHLKSIAEKIGDQFDLGQLAPGDKLKVVTQHTDYVFTVVEGRDADLECSRADRPSGRVRIMGCTFGHSSSIKPDDLFCGGNLEFAYALDSISMTHKTTAIKAIYYRSSRQGPSAA